MEKENHHQRHAHSLQGMGTTGKSPFDTAPVDETTLMIITIDVYGLRLKADIDIISKAGRVHGTGIEANVPKHAVSTAQNFRPK
jgi:hypothetical protein